MLKMNDLVKLSDTPKSTILYYVKEGLLPEPVKDKPNFHLYDERCVQWLAFIKYLQTNFNATISQIKQLFAEPDFDWDRPYQSLMSSLMIIMGAENETFTSEALCAEFNLSEAELHQLVEAGLLNPRHHIFTAKEREILAIIRQCDEVELQMIYRYAEIAKQLASQEVSISLNALQQPAEQDHKLKHLLDVLLVLKPYVLNMQTLNTYQREYRK